MPCCMPPQEGGPMMSGYRIRNFLPALAAGLLLAGCNMLDEHAPAAPRGLYSVTGDGRVTLHWLENTERDLDGYVVYYSLEGATGPYHKLEFTRETVFVDTGVHNGSTYWYAVSAVDRRGQPSGGITGRGRHRGRHLAARLRAAGRLAVRPVGRTRHQAHLRHLDIGRPLRQGLRPRCEQRLGAARLGVPDRPGQPGAQG